LRVRVRDQEWDVRMATKRDPGMVRVREHELVIPLVTKMDSWMVRHWVVDWDVRMVEVMVLVTVMGLDWMMVQV